MFLLKMKLIFIEVIQLDGTQAGCSADCDRGQQI